MGAEEQAKKVQAERRWMTEKEQKTVDKDSRKAKEEAKRGREAEETVERRRATRFEKNKEECAHNLVETLLHFFRVQNRQMFHSIGKPFAILGW